MTEDREHTLNVRITETEVEMLRSLAADEGMSVSTYVRHFIHRQHRARFGDATRVGAKTKKRARA